MFKKIFIPVDFSINTEMAIKKGLELIEPTDSVIYLLHIEKMLAPWSTMAADGRFAMGNPSIHGDNLVNQEKLFQWRELIRENYPSVDVNAESVKAMIIENAIIDRVTELKPDIIIIGTHSHHRWFTFLNSVFPDRIAKVTDCPVLVVKPGSIYNKIKSIVVPVGSFVPNRKMELLSALRRKFRITIHLVTVIGNTPDKVDFSSYALLKTYRFLRETVPCPIGHEVLHGDNIAKSTLTYAQKIKADMLLVDPETETRLASFPDKHISDELRPDSRLQILTVQP